jgi:hypothetical protein
MYKKTVYFEEFDPYFAIDASDSDLWPDSGYLDSCLFKLKDGREYKGEISANGWFYSVCGSEFHFTQVEGWHRLSGEM